MSNSHKVAMIKATSQKKSKRAKQSKETLVHFVLDETGSMNTVRDATIDGFNEYVNGLKQDTKHSYFLTLTKFDSTGIKLVYDGLPLNEVPALDHDTYKPGAMTNLNDAIAHSIKFTENTISKRKKKCNVLIIVMTDGHENASVEYRDVNVIREMVKNKEADGWTITFLGANLDAQKVGSTYAIQSGNTKSYSVHNMAATMRGLSDATIAYASSTVTGSATNDFFAGTDDWTTSKNNNQKTTSFVATALDGAALINHSFGAKEKKNG